MHGMRPWNIYMFAGESCPLVVDGMHADRMAARSYLRKCQLSKKFISSEVITVTTSLFSITVENLLYSSNIRPTPLWMAYARWIEKEWKSSDDRMQHHFEWNRTSRERVEEAGTSIEKCFGPCKSFQLCVSNLFSNFGDSYSLVSTSLTVDTGIRRQLFEIVQVSHTKYLQCHENSCKVLSCMLLSVGFCNQLLTELSKTEHILYMAMIFLPFRGGTISLLHQLNY